MIGTLGQFVKEIRDKLAGSGDPIPVDIGSATVNIDGDVVAEFDDVEAALGYPADEVATSDTGTSSLIGLIKRLLGKTPTLVSGRVPVDIGDITFGDVEIKNDSGNPVPIVPAGVIDAGNGYSGTLAGDQVFTGTGVEASPKYGTVSVCIFSSHASASNGLKFQASIDNINWETIEEYTYSAVNKLESYSFAPSGRYFRVIYTNGATATTKTAILTVLRTGYTKSSSHRIGDTISAEKDAELVKAVLAAMKPSGEFTDIHCTAGGNLKVSVEETEGSLPVTSSVTARTPTTTSVTSSASSVTILAANANRRGVSIFNDSTATLRLSFSTPATAENTFIGLPAGAFLLLDQQLIVTGAIYGIWASANGTAQVTEYV